MGETRAVTYQPASISEVASKVATTTDRWNLLQPSDVILVAFSGGADSSALVVLLKSLGYEIVLGHVDHGMRKDSHNDRDHCGDVASHLGLRFVDAKIVVVPPTEARARKMRYEALEEMRVSVGAAKIATGHTLDDDAETVVMRKRRGGFPLGIPPLRGNIVRPLIDLRRSETEMTCRLAGITFIDDPTNRELGFTRNRIRREMAEQGVDPVALAAEGRSARLDVDAARARALALYGETVQAEGGVISISRDALLRADPSTRHATLRMLLAELDPDFEPSQRIIEDVAGKILMRTGAALDLHAGLQIWSEPSRVCLGVPLTSYELPEMAITIPGETDCVPWGFRVIASRCEPHAEFPSDPFEEIFDSSIADSPTTIRPYLPGDRFRPLGLQGSKKVHDIFVDEKVPRRNRYGVPLLSSGPDIAWLIGLRMADRFKVTDVSTSAFKLRVEGLPPGP